MGLLDGKNAVITGCKRGIGHATMLKFAENGANIWACFREQESEVENDCANIAQLYGIWVKPVYFDLSDSNSIKVGLTQIKGDHLPVDILVNNAGIIHNALFQMTSSAVMESVFQVDYFAQMQITQFIARLMLHKGSGSIVNVSSMSALDGLRGQIAYSSAKGALVSATKTMSIELASGGVRVNAVAPGVIDTSMVRDLTDAQLVELVDPCHMSRLGLPDEVANAIVFLASDLASYITGQVLRVDGGM